MDVNEIFHLILERNTRETTPFFELIESNATLHSQVDALQNACELAKHEIATLRFDLHDAKQQSSNGAAASGVLQRFATNAAAHVALQNETNLREKIERLEEELNTKTKQLSQQNDDSSSLSLKLSDLNRQYSDQQNEISQLRQENKKMSTKVESLTMDLEESNSNVKLAEQQHDGLKNTIRVLQSENDALQKEKKELESRLVSDKTKLIDEMNGLNDIIEDLRKHIDMLKYVNPPQQANNNQRLPEHARKNGTRNYNQQPVVNNSTTLNHQSTVLTSIPSAAKLSIYAHAAEGNCLVFERTGKSLIATASADATVKVWDAESGTLRCMFRGSYGHSITCCDLVGNTLVGSGSDKTCRVWNLSSERMVHQLVGHQHKIMCSRLFHNERGVLTGSTDCNLKIWDISRSTYRQKLSLHSSSIPNCVDLASDGNGAISGHIDGGLRFWDVRSGDCTNNMKDLHEHGISSVQYDRNNSFLVLTTGFDATIKLLDIRSNLALQTFQFQDDQWLHTWSNAGLSQDSKYVASGSSKTGHLFIWDTIDGSLVKKKSGHESGILSIDWSREKHNISKIATIDRKGKMILWT